MSSFLFQGGRFLNPRENELQDGISVLVEEGLVKEVSDRPIRAASAQVIDVGGRTVMPGLIDAHIHMYYFLARTGPFQMRTVPPTYAAAMATYTLRNMLMRGFTTVRDVAGGDYGLRDAAEAGFVETPRLFISGRGISQTGGHGDFRERTDIDGNFDSCCNCGELMSVIADGVPDVIKAVREELRKGVDHIKIMVSGGVASQNDPLDSIQYREDEIFAAVDEARRWGCYVAAHSYGNEAIMRAVGQGVRTIEHGNLIEPTGAKLMAERQAFLVPTLVTYHLTKKLGPASGKSDISLAKNDLVYEGGFRSLELCKAAGAQIGFGTDLMTYTQQHQCEGLAVQADATSKAESLRSATIVNAEIVRQQGKLGELVPGAHADLLVVDGDPYKDLGIFQDGGPNLAVIMKAGKLYKNSLA